MLLNTIFPMSSIEPLLSEVEVLRLTSEYSINFCHVLKKQSLVLGHFQKSKIIFFITARLNHSELTFLKIIEKSSIFYKSKGLYFRLKTGNNLVETSPKPIRVPSFSQ